MKKIGGIKKGLIYAMVTSMLATGTIGMMPLNASAATTGKVNTSALNVRSGAGTSYAWVGTVRQGQTVTIVDSVKASDGYTWYKISGTTSGYVRSDYISNVASDSVESKTGTIIADVLNVRTGAGRNYSIMGTVSYGTRVTIVATSGEWYKVNCKVSGNLRSGYVHKDYVKVDAVSGESSSGSSSNTGSSSSNTGSSSSSGSTSTETVIATGVVNASSLNLRSGAGTNYSSLGLLNKNTSLEILSQTGSWYKVRCTLNGSQKTGYVHSSYVTKTATSNNSTQTTGTGVVNADVLNVRSGAGTSNSVLDKLYMNAKVEIISQVGNWYNIKYTKNGATKTGYVAAEYITRTSTSTPTPTPTPETESKVPETESKEPETESKEPETENKEPETPVYEQKNGTVNADALNVRKSASMSAGVYGTVKKGTKVVIIGEEGEWYKVKVVVNGTTKEAYVYADYITVEKETSSDNNAGSNTGSSSSTNVKVGVLTGNGVYLRKGPGQSYAKIDQLSIGTYVQILDKENGWFKVSALVDGIVKQGYVCGDYMKDTTEHNEAYNGNKDQTFEDQIAAFPEAYKNALRRLHDKYPNWKFVAYDTGLDFNDVLSAQYSGDVSMIYFNDKTTPFSWLSTKAGDYDWSTDTYANRDGATWKSASKEVIAYCLDPRNFLVEDYIFMFESEEYNESQSREVVASILKGSVMADGKTYTYNGKTYTYVDTFMEAGKIANVSPYILASRSRQEVGGGSDAITGTHSSYKGYYNFFNIGANSSASGNALSNGLKYAATSGSWRRPWTSPWLAIVGGAEFIGESYIAKGQNTDYFQRFNVVSEPYNKHQYMTNVQSPISEGRSRFGSYRDMGVLDGSFTFIIPIYNNMPQTPCQMPVEAGNPNGYLKTLKVSGMDLNQTFKYNVTEYYGATNQSSITISATAISKYAKGISGTGTYSLNLGENTFKVVCEAGNGDTVTYTIKITRYN